MKSVKASGVDSEATPQTICTDIHVNYGNVRVIHVDVSDLARVEDNRTRG